MNSGGTSLAQQPRIERIVREVLAELAADRSGESPPMGSAAQGAAQTMSAGGELTVSSKVVCAKELEGRLGGVTRVIVPRGAVLTPTARDLLRDRKIAIATAVDNNPRPSQHGNIVIGVAETNYEPHALDALLTGLGLNTMRLPQGELIGMVERICQHVVEEQRWGLFLTGQSAAALCLANRRRGVRAALGSDVAAVAEAVRSIGPNVLVVDPRGQGTFEWKRIVHTWLQSDGHCPPRLREQLG
jgi:hypothetical protein